MSVALALVKKTGAAFAVENFSDVYEEAFELLQIHYEEIAPYKHIFKLNPDLGYYRALAQSGNLCIVTARNSSVLIGYIVMLIKQHIHYKDTLVATDDIHFIHPAYRKGSLGSRLMLAAEKEMLKRHVKIMFLRTKAASNHGVLFERLGYSPIDIVYGKELMGV